MKLYRLAIILSFLFLLVFGACSSDNSPSDDPEFPSNEKRKVNISLSTLPASVSEVSDEALSNEIINTWWMVFVNAQGIVETVIERRSGLPPVEKDTVTAKVPIGNYTLYAFANVSKEEIEKHTGPLSEGQKVPDDMASREWKAFPEVRKKSSLVPMSGFKTIRVTSNVNQTFSIEVVRMVAKMTFSFRSEADEQIKVNYVTIDPMPLGAALPLLPVYESLGKPLQYTTGGTPGEVRYDFEGKIILEKGHEDPVADYFYIREAVVSLSEAAPTGRFTLGIGISRGSRDEECMYTLTAEDFTCFNRNDHILIPILFTDYIVRIEALFYPPIGGYPAMIVEEKNEQFYVKFGTGGTFVITPRIMTASPNALPPTKDKIKVEVTGISGDKEIFEKAPSIDAETGEITGVLDGSKDAQSGTAAVTISMTIELSEKLSRKYDRTIFIIRE